MSYLDESRLSAYDSNLKEWISSQDSKTIISSIYPWTKTIKAGAVLCYPVGDTELKPVVDFLFTEVPPASGDKGSENPSTITGVSSVRVTRCGANLFKYPYYLNTNGQNSTNTLKWEPKTDGTVRLIIDSASVNTFYYMYKFTSNTVNSDGYFSLQTGKYRVSLKLISGTLPSGAGLYMSHYSGFFGETATIVNTVYDSEEEFTVSDYSQKHLFIFKITPGVSADIIVRPVLTLLSDTDDAIEQYAGADYTLPFSATYYGGKIDLATGVMTVTHIAVTPDASTIDISSAPAALPLDYTDTYGRTITSADGTSLVVGSTGGTVVYKLATPQIVQLTPTQILALIQADKYTPRVNTMYSDQESIQVGYVKSPIREEYELQQAIVSQGGSI